MNETAEPAKPRAARGTTWLLLLVVAIGSIPWVLRVLVGEPRLPALNREVFDAAWKRWQTANLDDYRITTEVTARTPGTYEVEVRGGKVVQATRNGLPLQGARTLRTWAVPGMFDTMEYDVDRVAAEADSGLMIRAEFHPDFGYPVRYTRSDRLNHVRWEVTEFAPLPDED